MRLALSEFYRVLKPQGKLVVLVPDILSVAEAIPRVGLEGLLYESPSGPIRPIDVLYGHQGIQLGGNGAYAHKSGFCRQTLEETLRKNRFRVVASEVCKEAYDLQTVAIRDD